MQISEEIAFDEIRSDETHIQSKKIDSDVYEEEKSVGVVAQKSDENQIRFHF